jgi:Replication-relaxation
MRLTDRDRWILESLGKLRFGTTRQLADLHFEGSRSAANKRLRKLLDGGLVRAWVRDLADDNIYALDRRGAALVGGSESEVLPLSVVRGLDRNLEHLLAINDVRLGLALGLGKVGSELAWWRSDWELRSSFRERLVPDALFAIQSGEGEQVFALEVENRSRSAKGFLKKLLGYVAAESRGSGLYGLRDFLALVVGRDGRWVERYRVLVGATHRAWRVWFTTLESLRSQGVDAPIWTSPDGSALSLRELVSLPYRKEGRIPATDAVIGTYTQGQSTDIPR